MRATLELERAGRDGPERWPWEGPFDEGAEGEPSQERMEDFFEGWEAYQA